MHSSKTDKKPSFIPIAALTFINVVGITIFIPVLPFIVKDYAAPTWVYGLLLASYPAAQFVGSPILGELSDRIGRKPVLLLSQAGTLLSWFFVAISYLIGTVDSIHAVWPISLLLFSRVVDGITGGNTSVANAYLADITPRHQLTKAYGRIGAITGFAVVVGPALGSYSSSTEFGYLGMAAVSIILSSVTLVLMWKFLDESLAVDGSKKRLQSRLGQINVFSRVKNLKSSRGGKLMLGLNAGFALVMAGYSSIIALFLIDRFNMTQTQVGNFLLLIGAMLIFNQYVLVTKIVHTLGELKTLIFGMVLLGVGLSAITLTDIFWLYVVLYYSVNLGISLVLPTGKSLLSKSVGPDMQGEIQGLDESLRSLARAGMPVFMGFVYGFSGFRSFYLLTALTCVVLSIFWILSRKITITKIKDAFIKSLSFINVE